MSKYVYGPVPSRRLGKSLGISTIPFKTCDYSCIYCQLGRTTRLTVERKEYFPLEDIVDELKENIRLFSFDTVTIIGEGEPTLYSKIGNLIDNIKKLSTKKCAVITNGSLLWDKNVREELSRADIILPSLDAWNEESFKRINRPHKSLNFEKIVEGMITFRKEYKGEIWLEVMLISGLNDANADLLKIAYWIDKIKSDKVYINVPIRPPAEPWVRIPNISRIRSAEKILKGIFIGKTPQGSFFSSCSNTFDAIISIIKRHPMSYDEVVSFSKSRNEDVDDILEKLQKDPNVETLEIDDKKFFKYRKR